MSSYNPNFHHRRSIRLKGYDYSQAGLYFITICVKNRKHLFGQIINGKMILNDAGKMVENEWLKLPQRFPNIHLHEYVVMPNHFHTIIEIIPEATLVDTQNDVRATLVDAQNDVRATLVVAQNADTQNDVRATLVVAQNADAQNETEKGQPQGIASTEKPKTIGDIMGAFQSIVTVEYIRGVKKMGWQPFDGKLWQRNYWEHIIRNEKSCQRIAQYIINNPAKWNDDKFYDE